MTTRKKDDSVQFRAEEKQTVFIVKSPSGIGQAIIERLDDSWPKIVMLRLHLKGLESFRATNGKVTLNAAVSSQDGKRRIWKDGKEDAPLDEKSPFWMDIRIVGGGGGDAAKDGYFEMALPKAFLEGQPKSVTLNWIDFYRN